MQNLIFKSWPKQELSVRGKPIVLVIAINLRGLSRMFTITTIMDILVEMLKKKSQMMEMERKEKMKKTKKSLPHA